MSASSKVNGAVGEFSGTWKAGLSEYVDLSEAVVLYVDLSGAAILF